MRSANSGKRRVFPMLRVKQAITCAGTMFVAPIACAAGITPQAGLGPMFIWMHGYGAEKGQGTAMPVTLAACTGFLAGAAFRMARMPVTGLHYHPTVFLRILAIFVGVTLGAMAALKPASLVQRAVPRRLLLLTGVALGVFCVANAGHTADVGVSIRLHVLHGGLSLIGLAAAAGALTQVTGLSSGTVLFPLLYFFTNMSAIECSMLGIGSVALASILPALGYSSKGWVEKSFSGPASLAAFVVCMACGFRAGDASDRLIMLLYALLAMFFAAREMSAATAPTVSKAPDI